MKVVKGFKDFSGEEAKKRKKIKEILLNYFEVYGFEPVETPIIEYEKFMKLGNEEAISDIFRLTDKGKRKLALRYEFTFQLKRIAREKKLPYRRYQIGEVFRDEPVSSRRFRQFTQCDVDIVGSSVKEEAEILSLASKIFSELGIDFFIQINNRKLLDEVLEEKGIKKEFRKDVIKEIDKLDKLPEEIVKKNLKKFKAEKILNALKKPEKYFEKYDGYKEIKELKKSCKLFKVKVNFVPTLARGLNYYTGNIFEIKTKNMKESIAGGGTYEINGVRATGISFGLDRILLISNVRTEEKRVLIISLGKDKEAIGLLNYLRENKVPSLIYYGKPSKALEYANFYGIKYVIFVGEEELRMGKFKLKDMNSGKEKLMAKGKLIKELK